jgi:hypothetical protein
MRYLVIPLLMLALAACVHSETVRPASTTVVAPAPQPDSSTTVIR